MASKNQNKTQNQNSDIRSEASHYRRDPTFFFIYVGVGLECNYEVAWWCCLVNECCIFEFVDDGCSVVKVVDMSGWWSWCSVVVVMEFVENYERQESRLLNAF